MRIRVCTPFYSEFEFAKPGMLELQNCKEHEFIIEPRQGSTIAKTRNHLINDGKSSLIHQNPLAGFDYFLTVDSDIGFTLSDVLSMLERNVQITCLPYLVHEQNVYDCGIFSDFLGEIGGKYSNQTKGFKRIQWAGSGMMLVRADVYSMIEYPWYRHRMVVRGNYQEQTGEDIGFCVGACLAGIKIYCDFDRPVKHKERKKDSFDWTLEQNI